MPNPLDHLFLWVGQPANEPEHLVMMLTSHKPEEGGDGSEVYRPLMAVSREHADQLADLAQQAADGMGVPVALREYHSTDATFGAPVLVVLEPRTCTCDDPAGHLEPCSMHGQP